MRDIATIGSSGLFESLRRLINELANLAACLAFELLFSFLMAFFATNGRLQSVRFDARSADSLHCTARTRYEQKVETEISKATMRYE